MKRNLARFLSVLIVVLLILSLSGCFSFLMEKKDYFPIKSGSSELAIVHVPGQSPVTLNAYYSLKSLNGHNDLVLSIQSYQSGKALDFYFRRNSNGNVYWEGLKSSGTLIPIQGCKLIDNAYTGQNESPIVMQVYDPGDGSMSITRTSKLLSSINIEGKVYQNVLKVSLGYPMSFSFYFANNFGIVRFEMTTYYGETDYIDFVSR